MKASLAFVKKHSYQTALVKLLDQWMSCIDKGDLVGSLFIDFRKAFGVVDHRNTNEKTPQYVSELLKPTRERHLRSSSNGTVAVPRSRTSVFDRSFSVLAPRLWNSIPIDVRNSTTLNGFRNSIRNVFFDNFIEQYIFVIF